ncbi:MAG: type II secretion system protein GspM [Gemmatimonadaceae bacterium]
MTPSLSVGQRDRWTLVIGIVACGAIVGAGRGVPVLRAWVAARLAAAAGAEQQLASAEAAAGMAASIESNASRARQRAASADAALIHGVTPSAAGAALSTLLSDRADSTGLGVSSETVRADTGFTRGFARARVRLSATSDIRGLTRFLADVEGSPHLLAVRDLTISQSDPGAGDDRPETLRIEIVVEALVRPAVAARPRPAPVRTQTLPLTLRSLRAAADTAVDNDPFRLSNSPPDVDAVARTNGPRPAAPSRPPRPMLVLKAITGGPPWQAIVAGIPGQSGDALVAPGTVLGALTVQSITRDAVVVRAPDTTWTLSLKRSPP